MNDSLRNSHAADAAIKLIIEFCKATGCLYCNHHETDGEKISCRIGTPREWRINNDK